MYTAPSPRVHFICGAFISHILEWTFQSAPTYRQNTWIFQGLQRFKGPLRFQGLQVQCHRLYKLNRSTRRWADVVCLETIREWSMILIADSRLAPVHCSQTLGLVWSNELLMGGNSHAQQCQLYSTTLAAAVRRPHTQDTRAAHFINIKPEKQGKNVEIVPDACPVTQTEKCGANVKGWFGSIWWPTKNSETRGGRGQRPFGLFPENS